MPWLKRSLGTGDLEAKKAATFMFGGPKHLDGEAVVKIQWRDSGNKPISQAIDIYVSDGPECLKSLAEFVAGVRLKVAGGDLPDADENEIPISD
jgi:hypothetical protein